MNEVEVVTKIFLVFLCVKALLEAWLEAKNKQCILAHRKEVPAKFQSEIGLEDHQKAADYSVAKINSGKFFQFYDIVILLILTLGGGLTALDLLAQEFVTGVYSQAALFFVFLGILVTILSLPQSIYSTFVIEEKFGFNKVTPTLFISDLFKSLFLGGLIGIPIMLALVWFVEAFPTWWWVIGWMFLTLVQLILMWAYPVFIAPLFNKFSPLEEGEVKERILALLKRTGFKSKGLFIMDASKRSGHGNAYFTGFGENKRIVFFDNLIKTLNPKEVEAVLAHELGHFKRKHVLKLITKSVIMSFIGFALMGFLFSWEPFFLGHGVETMNTHIALALFSTVAGVYTFFLTPLSAWWSRKFEFEADTFAANNADARDLISALVKLYKDNASTLTPDPTYSKFYHSHPPAFIRVQFLEGLLSQSPGSERPEQTKEDNNQGEV